MDQPAILPLLIAISFIAAPAHSLVGYDCGGQGLNITSLSLLDIGNCELEDIEPNNQQVYVQLLQLSDFDKTQAIQYKVEIDRTIYCGMRSHVSIVHNGRREYLQELTPSTCR